MPLKNNLRPIHPGEYLREDVLPATGMSVSEAARALGISRQMLHSILAERKPLSAVMCLRISKLFGSTPDFWMRLQAGHDIKKAEADPKVKSSLDHIKPHARASAAP